MKPFYSVVYLKPESASDEKVAVGLFLNTDNRPIFDYSDLKLKAAARLIDPDAVDSVEKMLKNIKRKIKTLRKDSSQKEAFEIGAFSESYFDYLSRYSNNMVIYSKPTENSGDFSADDYSNLFKLLVDKHYGEKEFKPVSFRKTVAKALKSSPISNRVDLRYRIPKNKVKSLFSNHEVDYIGINESIISGNSLDTHTDPHTLEMKIYKLRALTDGLLDLANVLGFKNEGRHTLLYNDPEGRKQKDIIYSAKKDITSHFKLKPWEEFEEEEHWIEEHNVRKFSELEKK